MNKDRIPAMSNQGWDVCPVGVHGGRAAVGITAGACNALIDGKEGQK